MVSIQFVLWAVLSYLCAVGAYMSLSLLWMLRQEGDVAMASLQLEPEETLEDFKSMQVVQLFMILGFVIYLAGSVSQDVLYTQIGWTYAVIFALFVLRVLYQLWVRLND